MISARNARASERHLLLHLLQKEVIRHQQQQQTLVGRLRLTESKNILLRFPPDDDQHTAAQCAHSTFCAALNSSLGSSQFKVGRGYL